MIDRHALALIVVSLHTAASAASAQTPHPMRDSAANAGAPRGLTSTRPLGASRRGQPLWRAEGEDGGRHTCIADRRGAPRCLPVDVPPLRGARTILSLGVVLFPLGAATLAFGMTPDPSGADRGDLDRALASPLRGLVAGGVTAMILGAALQAMGIHGLVRFHRVARLLERGSFALGPPSDRLGEGRGARVQLGIRF